MTGRFYRIDHLQAPFRDARVTADAARWPGIVIARIARFHGRVLGLWVCSGDMGVFWG